MSFEEKKVPAFEHPISQLADQPNMQPGELKAYFDANPEILRLALNALCDALGDQSAASNLGFTPTAGIPVSTLQTALEYLHGMLADAVVGKLPSGSVNGDKLAQDVRDRFSAIESAATTEAGTRASADSAEASARAGADTNLQNQINSLSAAKCELYTGTYTGNAEYEEVKSQIITLGFRPKAVIIMHYGFITSEDFDGGMYRSLGGIAIDGWTRAGITITNTGFEVLHDQHVNSVTGMTSTGLNTKNRIYIYLAFK